jgi:hypothetical protein
MQDIPNLTIARPTLGTQTILPRIINRIHITSSLHMLKN